MATYTDNYQLTKPLYSEVADIATINNNMDKVDDIMHNSQISIADAYDQTQTYQLGEKVMYEMLLYRCVSAITTPEVWNPDHWERTTAADEGGNYVDVDEKFQTGLNVADIDVDGDQHTINVPYMTGATSQADGTAGLPPAPEAGDENKFFKGDGSWGEVAGSAEDIDYDNTDSGLSADNVQDAIDEVNDSLQIKYGTDNSDFVTDRYIAEELTLESSKYIKGADGAVSDIASALYVVADNIDVEGRTAVVVSGCATFANGICAFYDSSHDFLSWGLKAASGSTATIYRNELVAVPSGAKYMAVASMTTTAGNPYAALNDGYKLKKWTGLKWVCIGDSLTERNQRTTMNYHDYISKEMGITIINMGKSGSGYMRVGGSGDNFYQRALTIPTNADVVTIFGSGNDSIYMDDELGTATDTGTETLGGCINTTIDNIYSRIPTVQLGIVAPTPWDSSNPADETSGWSNYVELLRQICKIRSIPFLDLFHESNLRPWDASFKPYAYSKDGGSGVHPDETGHKLIAGRFRVFVDSLLGITDVES